MTRQASPRWAFMDKFEVPNYDSDGNYLTRWRVVQTPWCSLFVHRFDGPDPRPSLHDHPWPFIAFIFRGGYVERRLNPHTMEVDEAHRIRFMNRMKLSDAHSIVRLLRVPTWSILFVGRRVRTWGYLEPDPFGSSWTWTPFDKHRYNDEFEAALARRSPS